MDSLIFPEVLLLLLILSIWLFSVYQFIKRYQLVLCFNTRDVPFYKSTLFNKTNDNLDNHSLVPLTSFVENKSTCDCSTNESQTISPYNSHRSSFTVFKLDNDPKTLGDDLSTGNADLLNDFLEFTKFLTDFFDE